MFHISLMHLAPEFPRFDVSKIFSSLLLEKESLDLRLDAPKLEISQVLPRSLRNELLKPFSGKYDVNNS